jgi:tetratricopeptide (TPR) repeat protein
MSDMPEAYYLEGKYVQAEGLFAQALAADRLVLGPEHPSTLDILGEMGTMYQREGKYDLAERYAAEALEGRRHALGPEHPDTMDAQADLVLAYVSERKFVESEPLAKGIVEFGRKNMPDEWQRFRAESMLGDSLAGQKKYTEAEPLLMEGYQGLMERKGRMDVPDWYYVDRAHEWLVQLYQAWGKPEKAAEWKKK